MHRTQKLIGIDACDSLLKNIESRLSSHDSDELVNMIVETEVKTAVRDAPPLPLGELMELLSQCRGHFTFGVWEELIKRREHSGRNDFWVGYVANPNYKGFGELILAVIQVLDRTVIFEVRQELGLKEYVYDKEPSEDSYYDF